MIHLTLNVPVDIRDQAKTLADEEYCGKGNMSLAYRVWIASEWKKRKRRLREDA